jgi:hypothetical protein
MCRKRDNLTQALAMRGFFSWPIVILLFNAILNLLAHDVTVTSHLVARRS